MVSFVLLIGLAIALILAAVIDVRESRIPNWLTFSLAGFGMVVHGWHQGFNGLILSVEGLAVGILCLIFFSGFYWTYPRDARKMRAQLAARGAELAAQQPATVSDLE